MNCVLQINQRRITATEIIPLLASYQLLPKLLREILIDEAISPFSYSISEREQAYQNFYQKNQLNTEEQRQDWQDYYRINSEQLEALVMRDLKIEKFKQATWGTKVESYFFQYKSKLDRVIFSVIRTTDIEIAQELFFRLQAEEQSFSELAKQYSQGKEAQNGGKIGPIALGKLNPALAKLLLSTQPEEILPPTRLGEEIIIIQQHELIAAQFDEQMRLFLLDALFEAWIALQIKQLNAASSC